MGTATEYTLRRILNALQGGSVWACEGVTQILATNASMGAVETIYTVPTGRVGYLTSLYLYGRNNHANEQVATV